MRKLHLVEDLEFNKKYKEHNGVKDYDNYTYMIENQYRTLYEAEEVVNLSEVNKSIIENVVDGYRDLFLERGNQPTEAQLEFARTTAKILLGELKDSKTIPVIPAPCGFGKSTITFVFVKEVCKAIRNGLINDGMIIVTDKLEELKTIHKNLIDDIGYFKTETKENKVFKTPFTYVLEGWTDKSFDEGVCLNKKVKSYSHGMCSESNCPFFTECKMSKQKQSQMFSPILLMTNARLETFGESVNQYNFYMVPDGADEENGKVKYKSQLRTMIINDEKPAMIDSISVSIPLVNNIENEIYHIPIQNEKGQKEKELLLGKWNQIRIMLREKLNHYSSKYDRFLVSNINNDPILLNDEEFVVLWNKYMGIKYKNEIKHIHSVLTRGGLFCNTKRQGIFINTIFMRDLANDKLKTVIFDATALVDPDYSSSKGQAYEHVIRFIDIESVRTFENVTFHFYQSHKINKSQFRSKNFLNNACVKFLESLSKNTLTYVVTYNEVASKILTEIKKRGNILVKGFESDEELWGYTNKVEIVTFDESTLFYFGNTKGSNKAKNCVQMVQFGWNALPDYIYATKYLCTDFNDEKITEIFNKCNRIEVAESYSKWLTHGDNYQFENPNLYLYQNYSKVTDFIQEVFRTKLRNYNFTGKVEIHCFQADMVLIGMIKQLFPNCNINLVWDKQSCFIEEKVLENGDGNNIISQLIKWVKDYDGTPILVNEFKDKFKLSDDYWKKLFRKNQKDNSIKIFTAYWNDKQIERRANKSLGKGKWIYITKK